jgi:ABC-type branched-subunit amino acid transport system ATPase component
MEFADNFYIMSRGMVVADGATADIRDELVRRHLSV